MFQSFTQDACMRHLMQLAPLVFLSPAMLEGSALPGVFLEQHQSGEDSTLELSLGESHALLAWGSIWNMALPVLSFREVQSTDGDNPLEEGASAVEHAF